MMKIMFLCQGWDAFALLRADLKANAAATIAIAITVRASNKFWGEEESLPGMMPIGVIV